MTEDTPEQLEQGSMDVLYWQTVTRDDAGVAKALWEQRAVRSIWALDQTALLDDYFYYLKRLGVLGAAEKIRPENGRRFLVPFVQLIMLYLAKQACGIVSMNALPDVLFSNEGAMRLLGFNAYQIRNGVCKRGQWRTKTDQKQGPVCPEMLAQNVAKMGAENVERLFNQAIRYLARTQVFNKRIVTSLDATDLLSTRRFGGCGRVTRKKHILDKTGQVQEIEITVYGWKLWALMECELRIPLAVKLAPIQTADNTFTRELIEQAQKNLGKWAQIDTIVLDRGFLDGEDLWWIQGKRIHFVIPARSDMTVHGDAQTLANTHDSEHVFPCERVRKEKHGYGKKSWVEERMTKLVGVDSLNCYDAFGPANHDATENQKTFDPNLINAVVVQKFDGKEPRPGKPCVLLTDLKVSNPFQAFDLYDQRSLIENSLWRCSKQYWHLRHAPQRNQAAVHSHAFLTMATIALTTCFRRWADQQGEKIQSGRRVGIQQFWRTLHAENAARVILFLDHSYGIFYLSEVFALLNAEVAEPLPEARSLDQLKAQYHLV
jgi:hypothetical protein